MLYNVCKNTYIRYMVFSVPSLCSLSVLCGANHQLLEVTRALINPDLLSSASVGKHIALTEKAK